MRYLLVTSFLAAIFLIVGAHTVRAETVLRINDSISLAVDQTVAGDFYGFAGLSGPVSLSGTTEGDAVVMGTSVTANGTIDGDLFAIGGAVQVHASVADDVRVIAGETTIAEYVGGDVVALGGTLKVLSSARIDGNIFFYGGEAEINGAVGGSIFGASERIRIDGPVSGGVDVTVGRALVIGDRADVGGDIRYESEKEMTRAPNAVVVGQVVHNARKSDSIPARDALVPFLVYAFSVLVVYIVFRNRLQPFMSESLDSFTRNGLIGIVGMVFLPIAIALLFITVIGSVIGLLGLFAYMTLYLASLLLASIFFGSLFNRHVAKTKEITLLSTLVGILVTEALFLVPVAGPVVVFVVVVVIFGTLLSNMYHRVI